VTTGTIQAVKPVELSNEQWEPKVIKKRDRWDGTFEVSCGETG